MSLYADPIALNGRGSRSLMRMFNPGVPTCIICIVLYVLYYMYCIISYFFVRFSCCEDSGDWRIFDIHHITYIL